MEKLFPSNPILRRAKKNLIRASEKAQLVIDSPKDINAADSTTSVRSWSQEEDSLLIKAVHELGIDDWSLIASRIRGSSDQSCRQRWFYHPKDIAAVKHASDYTMDDLYNKVMTDPDFSEDMKEYYRILKKVECQSSSNYHVMASPMFELSFLTIKLELHTHIDLSQPFHIYGHILLIDDLGNKFLIFKRNQCDAETINLDEKRRLIMKNFDFGSPRCLPKCFRLHVNLKDTGRSNFNFNEVMHVDLFNKTYDAEHSCDDHRFLTLNYVVHRCAVLACISVHVCHDDNPKNVEGRESKVNMNGSVFTSIYEHFKSAERTNKKMISRELCYKNCSPQIMGPGAFLIKMAVPVDSALEIEVRLVVGDDKIDDVIKYKAWEWSSEQCQKIIVGQKCSVVVNVSWKDAFNLPEYVLREWCDDDEGVITMCCHNIDSLDTKNFEADWSTVKEPYYITPLPAKLETRKWLVSDARHEWCESLVEIFSITICCHDDSGGSDLIIDGVIEAYRKSGRNSIDYFKLNEMKSNILYPHGPKRCHSSSNFGMCLDLKDTKFREISYGYFIWHDFQHAGWMNRRLCSVIPGKHGYAAVHYMIIEEALQAKLKCKLSTNSENVVNCDIRGSICARYNNYRYLTHYEQKYYQSTLLEKDRFEHVGDDGEVPLLKSVVAVPTIASLIVIVDIKIKLFSDDVISMDGDLIFKPQKSLDSQGPTVYLCDKKEISKGDYVFTTVVEWQ